MTNPYRILSVDNPADAVKLARKAKRVKNPQSTECILGIQRLKRAATAWEHETGRRCEGLAAPQIGWNARVVIVRKTNNMEPKNPRHFTPEELEAVLDMKNPHTLSTEELCKEYGLTNDAPIGSTENAEGARKLFAAHQAWLDACRNLRDAYDTWRYRTNGFFDPWLVMINPVIKQSEGERKATEGCLSVPHGGYEVTRPTHVAFKYLEPNGKGAGQRRVLELPNGRKIKLDEPNAAFLAKFVGDDHSAQVLLHEFDHLDGKCISNHGTLIIGGGDEKL